MRLALMLVVFLMTACGGDVEAPSDRALGRGCANLPESRGEADVTIDAVPSAANQSQQVAFTLRMTVKDQMDLRYPDGQRYDFEVYDSACNQVWRWSEGRFFTQALGQERLSPGEKRAFTESYTAADPGRYSVVGSFTAEGRQDLAAEAFFEVAP